MHTIEQIFWSTANLLPRTVPSRFDLYNPATAQVAGQVRLADEVDAERAIAAAKAAFPAWSQTTKQERIAALKRMHAAVTPVTTNWKRSSKSTARRPRARVDGQLSGRCHSPGD